MIPASTPAVWQKETHTALLLLEDGTLIRGKGFGAEGSVAAEICFNTALTGYQEILTDPSYKGQIVTFTFPHIGNVGVNREDREDLNQKGAVGVVLRADIPPPSNYRAEENLNQWLVEHEIIALAGVDTRALTALIRERGSLNCVIAHHKEGKFDLPALKSQLALWTGLEGQELAQIVSSKAPQPWEETPWIWNTGYSRIDSEHSAFNMHIVVMDYGVKRNILRLLAESKARITILPAKTDADAILALKPDGVFLSNGPGDPTATAAYAMATVQKLLEVNIPLFGICLGHQILGLSLGAKTMKMHQGHHGANHPVKDLNTGKVEIVSMNHGFAIDRMTLPAHVEETHISLFDGSNCGLNIKDKPAFSVQYHPEASPGPQDSHYLFQRFFTLIEQHKK